MKTKEKQQQTESPAALSAKLLGHRIRIQALTILIEKVASPNQIAKEIGENLQLVTYHVKILREGDAIELMEEKKRGGANEHFYRATRRPELSESEWLELSHTHKEELAVVGVRNLFAESLAAVETGRMPNDPQMYLWWKAALLDQEGRDEVKRAQDLHVAHLLEIEAAANARAVRSAKAPSELEPTVLGVLGFHRARSGPVSEYLYGNE